MELKELIDGFAAKVGIETLTPDERGMYWLQVDKFAIGLGVDEADGSLILHTPVGTREESVAGEFAELLLQINYLYVMSAGGALAMDAEAGLYMYQRREALATLDLEGFTALVEKFVNQAELLAEMVTEFIQNSATAGNPPESAPLSGFLQV